MTVGLGDVGWGSFSVLKKWQEGTLRPQTGASSYSAGITSQVNLLGSPLILSCSQRRAAHQVFSQQTVYLKSGKEFILMEAQGMHVRPGAEKGKGVRKLAGAMLQCASTRFLEMDCPMERKDFKQENDMVLVF